VGVHVTPANDVHPTVAPYLPRDVLEKIDNESRMRSERVKQDFMEETADRAVHTEWHHHRSHGLSHHVPYVLQALTADLVITSQPSDPMNDDHLQRALLLHSGSPLLMISEHSTTRETSGNLAVAWNGTVESARAIREAMPLLIRAESVSIIRADRGHENEISSIDTAQNVVKWLDRHGVISTLNTLPETGLHIGLGLISYASELDADMLIMGGFGHSRLYDVVVGAATGDVLKHADMPVFLSH
jgi:nucleotide-binding universal stress UspA family protein